MAIYDITEVLDNIIDMISNLIWWFFGRLENIKFFNTNLLQFSVTILVLSVLIPVLFTIIKSGTNTIGKTGREIYKGVKNKE